MNKYTDQDKQEILDYLNEIRKNNKVIRIEVEMKEKNINDFCSSYRLAGDNRTLQDLKDDKCLYIWDNTANKYGSEYRLMFEADNNVAMPNILSSKTVVPRTDRQEPYTHRLNSKDIITYLFSNGYQLGNNNISVS